MNSKPFIFQYLKSEITEIVSAHLTFGDTLCKNLGQAFAKTWVQNCPHTTYAPDPKVEGLFLPKIHQI